MALMTHAHTQTKLQPNTADYNALTEDEQQHFDRVMELADNQGTNGEYLALMLAAAYIAGLHIEYGGQIRKCACSCWCPVIFDHTATDAHCIEQGDGYNLGRHQCPTCADRHRETA